MRGDDWTRNERTVWTDPIMALAGAVLKQWHDDGEPQGYQREVEAWKRVFWTAYETHGRR